MVHGENKTPICPPGVSTVVLEVIDGHKERVDVEETRDNVEGSSGLGVENGVVFDDVDGIKIVDVVDVVVVVSQGLGDGAPDDVVDVVLVRKAHGAYLVELKPSRSGPGTEPRFPQRREDRHREVLGKLRVDLLDQVGRVNGGRRNLPPVQFLSEGSEDDVLGLPFVHEDLVSGSQRPGSIHDIDVAVSAVVMDSKTARAVARGTGRARTAWAARVIEVLDDGAVDVRSRRLVDPVRDRVVDVRTRTTGSLDNHVVVGVLDP